jgi:hypothetical protein
MRKVLPKNDMIEMIKKLNGRVLTKEELLRAFGYSPTTNVGDTKLFHGGFLEPIYTSRPRVYKVDASGSAIEWL